MLQNSTVVIAWCRPRRRLRRRRLSTVRLGNRRRGFIFGPPRPVVQWSCMVGPLRVLKKFFADLGHNRRWIDAYLRSLPILRPQAFPLC